MLHSLKETDLEYELVGVDNTNGDFKSAAAALNYGGDIAKGELLVFLHQDILFNSPRALEVLLNKYKSLTDETAILGIYGALRGEKREISEGTFEVDTLDECLVILNRKTFSKFRFNERLCDGWHLYVVEMCIRIKTANGLVAVTNHDITHLSIGNVNEGYMKTYKRLMKAYKNEKWICTTCKTLPNNSIVFHLYYILWKMKKNILGNYPLMSKIKMIK